MKNTIITIDSAAGEIHFAGTEEITGMVKTKDGDKQQSLGINRPVPLQTVKISDLTDPQKSKLNEFTELISQLIK